MLYKSLIIALLTISSYGAKFRYNIEDLPKKHKGFFTINPFKSQNIIDVKVGNNTINWAQILKDFLNNRADHGFKINLLLDDNITSINDDFLKDCHNLTNISFFGQKTLIKNKQLKYSYNTNIKIIGNNFLQGCESLEKIFLPNKLSDIGDNAFFQCKQIRKITMPAALNVIGSNFANQCASLTKIEFEAPVKSVGLLFASSIHDTKLDITIDFSFSNDKYFNTNTNELNQLNLPDSSQVLFNSQKTTNQDLNNLGIFIHFNVPKNTTLNILDNSIDMDDSSAASIDLDNLGHQSESDMSSSNDNEADEIKTLINFAEEIRQKAQEQQAKREEADRIAKEEAERLEAEKKVEAERLAKEEAERLEAERRVKEEAKKQKAEKNKSKPASQIVATGHGTFFAWGG
jgi:hypothetical protein